MIHCPECGTANREGSKFCNECGHALQGGIRCPMCGAINSPDSDYCQKCDARLTSVAAIPEEAGKQPIITPSREVLGPERPPLEQTEKPLTASPDWLAQLRSTILRHEEEPSQDEGEILSAQWALDPLTPREESFPASEVTSESPSLSEPSDDWLARLRMAAIPREDETETPSRQTSAAPTKSLPIDEQDQEELPDWLEQLRDGVQAEAEELGSVLSSVSGRPEQTIPLTFEEPVEQPFSASPADVPAGGLPSSTSMTEAEPSDSEGIPSFPLPWEKEPSPSLAPAEIPEWLREVEPSEDLPPDEPPESPFDMENLPDWLIQAGLTGEAAKSQTSRSSVEGSEASELPPAAIPDWLIALRPGNAMPTEEEKERGDTEGSEIESGDEGIEELLPIEIAALTSPDTKPSGDMFGVLPEENPGAELFSQIIQTPREAQSISRRRSHTFAWPRLIVALLLIAAIGVPLATGTRRLFTDVPSPILASTIEPVYQTVNNLSPGQTVVIAFDFDPATAGELEPLAEALVDHLMSRQTRIVALSLLPAGPPVAQRVLDKVATNRHPDYRYGARHINLGYLAGNEVAVRSFVLNPFGPSRVDYVTGESAFGQVGLQRLSRIEDIALLMVITADYQDVRWWIEQASSTTNIPLVAGVSAAAEPFLHPYAEGETPRLAGIVAGLAGAHAYGMATAYASVESATDLEAWEWGAGVVLVAMIAGLFASPFIRHN